MMFCLNHLAQKAIVVSGKKENRDRIEMNKTGTIKAHIAAANIPKSFNLKLA